MTEAESTPIVINSEEEDEDDDDIVVLKEEKVSIPADDDDDDDDAVIFIASTSITKTKDNTVLGPKTEPSSSKDLTRSLSLTSSFDVSLNLTGPLDLSKHTERDGDDVVDPTTAAATSVKLSDKETLVDLEETDSQQSLTDDLLDSVGGSSLDNSFVGPGSPSVDSNSSSNSSVSLPATPPLKWSPQPSTSGVKTNSGVGGPPDLIVPQGKAGSPCIDDLNFLELLRKYDYPSAQSTDNQSCMSMGAPPSPSISVTSQPVGAVPTHIHPNSCDTTLSSSPTSLSANSKQIPCIGTSSISPTSKSLLRSGTTTCHTYSSSQEALPKTSSSANTVCQFTDLVHTTLSLNITPSPTSPVSKVTNLPKPTCVSTVQSSAGPSTPRTDLSSNSGLASDSTTGSNLNSDSTLASNSVLACGTGIRSGNSQSWTTGTSRLSQLSLPPRKRVRPDTVMLTPTSSSSKSDDACVNCKSILHDLKVSRCTQGHPACSTCLEDQVKLILTDKQGSLKCIMVSCGSYYPMSELKYTLPSMVVEILEDKLHKEHINFVCDMLLPDTGADDQSGTAGTAAPKSGKAGNKADEASAGKKQKFDEDVLSLFEPLKEVQSSPDEDEKLKSPEEDKPQKWDPMDKMVNLAIMALEPESDEYVEVAVNFYSTLAFPSADIVKISRVQNPILWKYYQLKRTEMIHENDGHQVDERQLFHGTNSSVIEAICKKGFDWRVCGKHGSVYGQGSYFAKAASYSHQYTEKVSGHRSRMMAIRTLSALTSSSRTSSSSSVFRQPPGSVLIGPFNQMQVNQLIPHNFLPPPAHMPLGSSLISGIHGQLTPPSTAAPPPPQPQSSSRSNLTVISNIFSGPMPTNSSNPVINSNQNMPVESNHPSSSAGMARGFPLTNSGRCSAFNASNNNTTFPQQANFLRQGAEPSPLRQNNSQKSTKDAKVRVVPMADITSSQTRKMFLAKVLVGKYTGGNTGHRRPPPFYPAEPYGKCYDSCVDNIWDPKIFVIFDSNQAYPEYIVEYNVMNE